jgi:hypothetical protein
MLAALVLLVCYSADHFPHRLDLRPWLISHHARALSCAGQASVPTAYC